MPAGISNGSSVQGERRALAIAMLCHGETKSSIAERLNVTRHTVRALEESEFTEIAQRKARIAAQTELIALKAADLINRKLEAADSDKIPLNGLVPVYGVAVDKLVALRADNSQVASQHLHLHLQATNIAAQFNDVLGSLQSQSNGATRALPATSPPILDAQLQDCNDIPVINAKPGDDVARVASGKIKKARARRTTARDGRRDFGR